MRQPGKYVEGSERRVDDLVAAARRWVSARDAEIELHWRVMRAAQVPERPRWPAIGLPPIVALAAVCLVVVARGDAIEAAPIVPVAAAPHAVEGASDSWHSLQVAEVGEIEVEAAADVALAEVSSDRVVKMRGRGTLRAEIVKQVPGRRVVVESSDLRVVVLGTKFDVTVQDITTVDLFQGRVRVEKGDRWVELNAGESIRSDDPRLNPAPVSTAIAIAPPLHKVAPVVQKEAVSRPVADVAGLAEQNDLYRRALAARQSPGTVRAALALLEEYERRYPNGMFVREAALRRFEILTKLGHFAEAAAVERGFEKRFPEDARIMRLSPDKESRMRPP